MAEGIRGNRGNIGYASRYLLSTGGEEHNRKAAFSRFSWLKVQSPEDRQVESVNYGSSLATWRKSHIKSALVEHCWIANEKLTNQFPWPQLKNIQIRYEPIRFCTNRSEQSAISGRRDVS